MFCNLNEVREKAHALFEELNQTTEDFDKLLNGQISHEKWYRINKDRIPENLRIESGCTRIVIWDNDECDFVYKINKYTDTIDYCAQEVAVYHKAMEYHVEDCFAWTEKLFDYCGVGIYAMEYCDVEADLLSSEAYEYAARDYCEYNGYDYDNLSDEPEEELRSAMEDCEYSETSGLMELASSKMPTTLFEKFSEFVNKFELCDLHAGNWGFRNHQLVLTDYAGYCVDLTEVLAG